MRESVAILRCAKSDIDVVLYSNIQRKRAVNPQGINSREDVA